MDNQQVISTISELIETCKDGEMGFRTCAENVNDSEIKAMLTERARHCAESASERIGQPQYRAELARSRSGVSYIAM